MELCEESRINLDVSDAVQIVRILSRQLSASEKADLLGHLKAHLLDQSIGNESKKIAWLKKLFCETPLMIMDLTADGAISFFTFFLVNFYPETKLHLTQDARISLLTDVELVIKQIGEFLPLTPLQHNSLSRLQAMTLSRLGQNLANTSKHIDLARGKFTAALSIAEGLVAEDPENPTFMRTLARMWLNLGHLDKDIAPATARSYFEKAAQIRERVLELHPEDFDSMYLLANCYIAIGDEEAFSAAGQDEAGYLGWYWKSYLLYKRSAACDPDNKDYLGALAIAYERFGDYRLQTEPVKALRWFRKSYVIRRSDYDSDRTSPANLNAYWVVCNKFGEAYSALEDVPEACLWFNDGLGLAERLLSLDPNNLRYNGILALACKRLAAELEECAPPKSHDLYVRSYTLIDNLIRDGLNSIDYCRNAVSVLEGLERIDLDGNSNKWKERREEIQKLLASFES